MIPADRFDPLAENFINLYPESEPGWAQEQLPGEPQSTNTINQGDVRLDHQFSADNRLFLRLSLTKGNRFLEPPLPGLANGGDYGTGTSDSKTWGAALGFTHVFSSNTVNELRVGFNRVKGSDGITAGGQQAPPPELTVPGVANDPGGGGHHGLRSCRLQPRRRPRVHPDLHPHPGAPALRHAVAGPRPPQHEDRLPASAELLRPVPDSAAARQVQLQRRVHPGPRSQRRNG